MVEVRAVLLRVTCGEMRNESIITSWLARERALQRRMPIGAAALVAIWAPVSISLMAPRQTDAQSHVESAAAVAAAPVFEVASVKPSPPQRRSIRNRHDPGMVDIRNFTLCDILADAYNVDNLMISGPSWLLLERYDIVAKILCVSMSTPKANVICWAIRGQPQVGLRRFKQRRPEGHPV